MGIENIRRLKELSREPKIKKVYRMPKVSAKKQASAKEEKDTELERWYNKIMQREFPVCWETGDVIRKEDRRGWRGSVAHILPKSLFPSVRCHPLNYLILSMWNGSHANFDRSWKSASKMKVWKTACERFIMIYPDISPKERKKLPEILTALIKEPF